LANAIRSRRNPAGASRSCWDAKDDGAFGYFEAISDACRIIIYRRWLRGFDYPPRHYREMVVVHRSESSMRDVGD